MASPFQSGPIQQAPAGLLGLLQIKSPAGRNPEVMEGNVQPVVELGEWWRQTLIERYTGAMTRNMDDSTDVAGFYGWTPNNVLVPNNEWWYITNYSIIASALAASDRIALQPAMRAPNTTQHFALGNSVASEGSGGTGTAIISYAVNQWIPPGYELGFWMGRLVGLVTVTAYLHRTVLRI